MKILLRCHSTDEHYDADCSYALVNLDPEGARRMLDRIALLARCHAEDSKLFKLYFWDRSPDFIADSEELEECLAEIERGERAFDEERFHLTDSFQPPEAERVECTQMIIVEDGVRWVTTPKHTYLHVTTATIPVEVLENVAASCCARVSGCGSRTSNSFLPRFRLRALSSAGFRLGNILVEFFWLCAATTKFQPMVCKLPNAASFAS
jgi:hypothetical protein